MPQLDGTGPEAKGRETGRSLGFCRKTNMEEILKFAGIGMGLRRKAGFGKGQARRVRSGLDKISEIG